MSRSEMLFEQIKSENINVNVISDALDMDRSTFYRKAKDPHRHFTVDQAMKLRNILQMSRDLFEAIFF